MKTAAIPAVRVPPELRQAAEDLLQTGETLSGFVEEAVKADSKGNSFWLDGGAEQIIVNPALLDPKLASKREFTGWGYDDSDIEVSLIGVPILQTNWK